jgi:hypothetical protein
MKTSMTRLWVLIFLVGSGCVCYGLGTPQFLNKMADMTLSEISKNGPDAEIARVVAGSMDVFWPRRNELLRATAPFIACEEAARVAAALDILYRLRCFQPMQGPAYDRKKWESDNRELFEQVDASVIPRLDRLLASQDGALLHSLALYLGVSPSPASKAALLQLAKDPPVSGQALICLTWHRDSKDLESLAPFLIEGGSEAASLPYHLRDSYGGAAVPYLLRALAEAHSPLVRLQAAFELVLMNEKAGARYLYEAVLHRNEVSNKGEAGEIRQFAIDRLGFPKDDANLADLESFLKSKM